MIKANFTQLQHDIIRDICNVQIQSLLRVAMEKSTIDYAEQMGIKINEAYVDEAISEMLREFDKLKHDPSRVFHLSKEYISMFKHILLNYDERYSNGIYNDHKCDLWKKINTVEDFCRHLNLN